MNVLNLTDFTLSDTDTPTASAPEAMNKYTSEKPAISGVLVLDKSAGMTSHDVVNRVRRLFCTRQVGHTGTLDPMATGALVVLIGRAVKASEYVTAGEKLYTAVLRLGVSTDTGDIFGNITAKCESIPDFSAVKEVLPRFTGDISQIPPMYSAIKVGGKKLYELARKGIEIEREPRPVTIFELSAEQTERADEFILRVKCSKGTYIRSLCGDIGEALGCHGTMAALRREQTAGFSLDGAKTLEEIEAFGYEERVSLLKPTESLFESLPKVKLDGFFAHLMKSGAEIYQKKLGLSYPEGTMVTFYDSDSFTALGEVRNFPDGSAIKPVKMFEIG